MCSATQAVKCGVASSSPSSLASVSLSFQSTRTILLFVSILLACRTVTVHLTLSHSHSFTYVFTVFSRHFGCGSHSLEPVNLPWELLRKRFPDTSLCVLLLLLLLLPQFPDTLENYLLGWSKRGESLVSSCISSLGYHLFDAIGHH